MDGKYLIFFRKKFKIKTFIQHGFFLSLMAAFILLVFTVPNVRLGKFWTGNQIPEWIFRNPDVCEPVKNIAYLKVHKSGSSAIQNLLFRYGFQHNLSFVLPKERHFNQVVPFQLGMVYPPELVGKMEFNIFAIHCKWNYQKIKLLMPEDTIFLASVRDPVKQFVSMFSYENLDKESGMELDEFIRNINKSSVRLKKSLGYNQMTYDFGLPAQEMDDVDAVRNLINEADEQFDLVLVSEYMEESLILLRSLLCFSYRDIVTLKINSMKTQYKVKKLNPETESMLRHHLQSDILLYSHFKNKTEQYLREFGEERMEQEKVQLKKEYTNVMKSCQIRKRNKKNSKGRKKFWTNKVSELIATNKSEYCQSITYNENEIKALAREKQNRKIQEINFFNDPP